MNKLASTLSALRCVTNVSPAIVGALLVMSWGCSDSTPTSTDLSKTRDVTDVSASSSDARGHQPNVVVLLSGTAQGEPRDIDGTQMDCFDVHLFDLETGRKIGDGTDCLDLGSIGGGNPAIEGFAISNTTFFHLPGGSIKSRNRTTIQPVIEGSPGSTHTTGDLALANNILDGTGRFRGVYGIAKLFGSVNMSRFFSENVISFNCIFVLSFDE